MKRLIHSILLCLVLCVSAPAAQARDVVVFAAASLKNVLDEAAAAFEATHEASVVLSYGGSSALARQIQYGAPADIFVSANAQWMDLLEDEDLIQSASRAVLAGNRLVLIAGEPGTVELTPHALRNALGAEGRLAMGHVRAVPAGIYGKAALEALGAWDLLSPNVVQTDNVRAALRLVTLGEAQFGIVYVTDAQQDERARVVAVFPQSTYPPIVYPAALTRDSTNPDAEVLLRFLQSDAAAQIFAKHGFLPGPAS